MNDIEENSIIYDGECPICSSYVNRRAVRDSFSDLNLIDARSNNLTIKKINRLGYDLNLGMILIENGSIHYGSDAMSRIATQIKDQNIFDKTVANKRMARAIYPILSLGRRLLLALIGRSSIRSNISINPLTKKRRLSKIIAVGMIGYLFLISSPVREHVNEYFERGRSSELFPVFSWSLFSFPKRLADKFSVVPIETMPNSPVVGRIGKITNADHLKSLRESQYRKTALGLFNAIRARDEKTAGPAKRLYENYIREIGVLRYRFVDVQYDVLNGTPYRMTDFGEFILDNPIKSFEKPVVKVVHK